MIDVEIIKKMVDTDLFNGYLSGREGILVDKILHLLRMKIAEGNKQAEEKEGKRFLWHLTKDGLIYNQQNGGNSAYGNIGCDEQGWSWNIITGPREPNEYYYCDYFDHESTRFFEYAYVTYFELLRNRTLNEVQDRIQKLMGLTTLASMDRQILQYSYNELDVQGLLEDFKFSMEEDREEKLEFHELEILKLIVLSANYLYTRINNLEMDIKHTDFLNRSFAYYYPEEMLTAVGYLDFFMDTLEEILECSLGGKKVLMDYILNVHFSYVTDENEKTPTLYMFTSKPLKEYQQLKSRNPDHELVPYLDKLVCLLENPACKNPAEPLSEFYLEPNTVAMVSEYTEEEYICCYYYYERPGEEFTEYVKYDQAFSIARKCFMILLDDMKKV